jgi:phage shock protein A
MGLISRISTVIKAKVSELLDRAEDPRQTMDYAYRRQVEHLRDVRRGIVEVTASRRRLELQVATLKDNTTKMDSQARQALSAGREDLARLALQRKQAALQQIQDLDTQIAKLQAQEENLHNTEQRLTAKVEAFRTQKEVIKAQYSAAEARVRIGESLTGLSEEMADVDMAVDRAREKTLDLQARAGAIDELVAVGTLEELTAGGDVVERELARMATNQRVDQELEQMKQQVGLPPGSTSQPKQLEEGR